jgi:N-acetylmuramoyl-L-alanine amidase
LSKDLQKNYRNIKDLGVKEAPFYVLIGAQMPSIMVETSFITNKREEKRLTSSAYQDAIVEGIVDGIRAYIKQIESVPGRG